MRQEDSARTGRDLPIGDGTEDSKPHHGVTAVAEDDPDGDQQVLHVEIVLSMAIESKEDNCGPG